MSKFCTLHLYRLQNYICNFCNQIFVITFVIANITRMEERFKQLLQEKGLSAAQFADLIEVNASAMSHILNGRNKPSFNVIAKIAQAFPDINLNFLISGKGSLYNQQAVVANKLKSEPVEIQTPASSTIPTELPPPPQPIAPAPVFAAQPLPSVSAEKKLKRVLLFFEDGSFEDYIK